MLVAPAFVAAPEQFAQIAAGELAVSHLEHPKHRSYPALCCQAGNGEPFI